MSAQLAEGETITYALDEIVEVFKGIETFTDMAQHYEPGSGDGSELQRSNNQYWKPIQQQSRDVDGWDLTGAGPDGVLELSIMGSLGDPNNTYRRLRADDTRDERAWRRAVKADAMRLRGEMEARGVAKAVTNGSFAVTNAAVFGASGFTVWDGLVQSESRMFDTEMNVDAGTHTFLNSTAYRAGGSTLVQDTSNVRGQITDSAYRDGLIQKQIAGIDNVSRHNALPVMTAQAATLTIDGDQSFAPIANQTVNTIGVPFDNRFADITVSGTATGVVLGDKFTIADVFAVSLDKKITLDYLQTFTVIDVNSQVMTVSPRPIAVVDGALNDLQKSYANVDTVMQDTAVIVFLNTTAVRANIVMAQDAMVIASSPIPTNTELFSNLVTEPFQVGPINGIIGWEGSLGTLAGDWRIAIWYEWNIEKPEQVGVILDGQV